MQAAPDYLQNVKKEFLRYKVLAEKAFEQLSEQDIYHTHVEGDNSIAVIVKHMSGNMRSRFTNFLTEDGEKSWRNRDTEFQATLRSRADMLDAWNTGWECLLNALDELTVENLTDIVEIRREPHTVIEAINRQLAHYAYHTGQIVFLAKSIKGKNWQSLSIPKGGSDTFNARMFGTDLPTKKSD